MLETAHDRKVERPVQVAAGPVTLEGMLAVPAGAQALVVFAHGGGSSRHSPRNRFVAAQLRSAGLGTLLFDLLTAAEATIDMRTRQLRFDITMLAHRLVDATDWLQKQSEFARLRIGYFGASTGAAAALIAAAARPHRVGAVVSRGGRPDLAGRALGLVRAPTLLIVGGDDLPVIELNRAALAQLRVEKELAIVPGASHLFEEPETLGQVALLAGSWFTRHLAVKRQPYGA